MSGKKTGAVLVAAIVIAVLAFYVLHRHGDEAVAAAPPAPGVAGDTVSFPDGAPQLASLEIQVVQSAPLPLAEPMNALIGYDEDQTARIASPIAGRVVRLSAQIGDRVKSGQTLATLDSPDLGEAFADLRKADADLRQKRAAYARAKALLDGGVIALRDVEQAEADEQQSAAEADRARLRIRNLGSRDAGPESDGESFALRAPLAGIVVERHINPAMEVQPDPQNPLFVVSDLAKMWVVIDLPEQDLSKVHLGSAVAVKVDAYPDRSFDAHIDRISPVLDPTTRRVQVICQLANADGALRPQMYARVSLLSERSLTAVKVPSTALVTDGLTTRVFVQTQPGTFQERPVKLAFQDHDFGYVSEGLEPGASIVARGAILLSNQLSATGG